MKITTENTKNQRLKVTKCSGLARFLAQISLGSNPICLWIWKLLGGLITMSPSAGLICMASRPDSRL